jgi:hypothetical protein
VKNNVIDLYDILSSNPVNLDDILSKIIEPGINKVKIHFVPDTQKYNIQKSSFLDDDDALFIRSKKFSSFSDVLFPPTSHT